MHGWQVLLKPTSAFKNIIFVWRVMKNAIPTDHALSTNGTKCFCCSSSHLIEYTTHLSSSSDVAVKVWTFFSDLMDITISFQTIGYVLNVWWHNSTGNTLLSWLFKMFPIMILWEIWKARNTAKFENMLMSPSDAIIANVKLAIQKTYRVFILELKHNAKSLRVAEYFDLSTVPCEEIATLVLWHPPRSNWYKLNSDGATKNNPGLSGSGGRIRDSQGNFMRAYNFFICIHTSLFQRQELWLKASD